MCLLESTYTSGLSEISLSSLVTLIVCSLSGVLNPNPFALKLAVHYLITILGVSVHKLLKAVFRSVMGSQAARQIVSANGIFAVKKRLSWICLFIYLF